MQRLRPVVSVLLVSSLVLLGACTKNAVETKSEDKAQAPASAKPAEPAPGLSTPAAPSRGTASIRGVVRFEGSVPDPVPIEMAADPYCKRINSEGAVLRLIATDGEKGLADAFVYVKSGLEGRKFDPPAGQVVLDQDHCRFVPRVFGIRVGQDLVIENTDATLHNVHSLPKRSRGFNLGMPMKGMKSVRRFDRPEVLVRIKCDVHPWMSAYAGVVDHPFYAVTDEHGRFSIEGLPAGEYVVAAVHPKAGSVEQRVQLSDGQAGRLTLRLGG